jgi:hypothetical protein
MVRPVRIDFPGARHHVINRGLRQGPVFIDDWCCQEFIALLPETVERFEIIVHGYALITTQAKYPTRQRQQNRSYLLSLPRLRWLRFEEPAALASRQRLHDCRTSRWVSIQAPDVDDIR